MADSDLSKKKKHFNLLRKKTNYASFKPINTLYNPLVNEKKLKEHDLSGKNDKSRSGRDVKFGGDNSLGEKSGGQSDLQATGKIKSNLNDVDWDDLLEKDVLARLAGQNVIAGKSLNAGALRGGKNGLGSKSVINGHSVLRGESGDKALEADVLASHNDGQSGLEAKSGLPRSVISGSGVLLLQPPIDGSPASTSLSASIIPTVGQNSDDSFDGIRWGQPINPPSSPLKAYVVKNGDFDGNGNDDHVGVSGSKKSAVNNNLLLIASVARSAGNRLHNGDTAVALDSADSTDSADSVDPNTTLELNDQTNSVLSKYGSKNININLIQTPSLLRTQSEFVYQHSDKIVPPLLRTKSTAGADFFRNSSDKIMPSLLQTKSAISADFLKNSSSGVDFKNSPTPAADFFRNSSNMSNNTLNDWIDKFSRKPDKLQKSLDRSKMVKDDLFDIRTTTNFDIPEKNLERSNFFKDNTIHDVNALDLDNDNSFQQSLSQVTDSLNKLESPRKLNPSLNAINTGKPANSLESDDIDPFTDDDDVLLEALDRATQNPQLTLKEQNIQSQNSKLIVNEQHLQSDSDDPFTDDDSAFMNVLSQVDNTASNTKPNIPILKSFSAQNKYNIRQEFTSGSFHRKPSNEIENNSTLSFTRPNLDRYQIKTILQRNYGPALSKVQLILDVIDGDLKNHKLIIRGEYTDLDYQINDIVHVIVTNMKNPRLIDDANNILIWNPDILLSATTISNQIICSRKTVLLSRYKFPGILSIPLIVGEIIHRIFQECFYEEQWSNDFMQELADTYVLQYLHSIFSIDETIDKVKDELKIHLPYLKTWFDTYYKKPLSTSNYVPTNKHNESIMLSVNKALDIEENIWSPMFGLNGMVDVTLETRLENKSTSGQYLLPLEIKTGREYITHLAQATLYSLLFKDRYDMDITSYLLVYTKQQMTKKCDISQNDLKALVNLRNKVTRYFRQDTRELPEILQSSTCERCEIQAPCMTINKLLENGSKDFSGLSEEAYEELTQHLENNPSYAQFYNHWDDLLTKEEGIMKKSVKYLWTLTAKQRELSDGKAIGNLVIIESDDNEGSKSFNYRLRRKENTGSSFLGTQLTVGDRIVVSDEIGHFGIAHGTIKDITYSTILISTSRRMISFDLKMVNFNTKNNQVFQGVLHKTQQENTQSVITFRIDKNDMYLGMALARFNLLNLFIANGDALRRNLIVGLESPRFSLAKYNTPSEVANNLNMAQVNAIQKVLSADNYALILGMPGTGKTTVIAQLINILAQQGKTILLASYTHSAVDNILLKLRDFGISILRVGYPASVHKDIRKYIPGYGDENKATTHEDFMNSYLTPQVVASSCLGINDITFSLRPKFDYCIIDEASQVSLPVSLGPLRFCEKFVLVGDHNQLPPLVQHPDIKVKQELSQSLFMKLSTAFPNSVATLTHQYRMCSDIMELSNNMIYENTLQCGSESVANLRLTIPYPLAIDELNNAEIDDMNKWINIVLKENNKVIFFDHDKVPALESTNGEIIENRTEAKLVTQIVDSLLHTGVKDESIGVMSFNRGQLRLLKRNLSHTNVDILTADQFQGRDKDCIIISLVRSNAENNAGDLVKEWRRINVAITRAKSKLVILGSRSTLATADTTRTFLRLLSSKHWIYELPTNADAFYKFDERSPKSSPVAKRHKATPKLLENNPILKDIMNEMTTG